jgi:hypothetical protein
VFLCLSKRPSRHSTASSPNMLPTSSQICTRTWRESSRHVLSKTPLPPTLFRRPLMIRLNYAMMTPQAEFRDISRVTPELHARHCDTLTLVLLHQPETTATFARAAFIDIASEQQKSHHSGPAMLSRESPSHSARTPSSRAGLGGST